MNQNEVKQVVLVTGPARSGKSEWAETLALETDKPVVYVATARIDPADAEWRSRIQRHQQRRKSDWTTLEVPVELTRAIADSDPDTCLLVDSLGTWVANLLEREDKVWQETQSELLQTVAALTAGELIFVAEETGWGVVPAYPLGRTFRDRLGDLVRDLGAIANSVYLVTGGHALNLSALGTVLPPPSPIQD